MNVQPKRIDGIPVCSSKCKNFCSTVESGWGISKKCLRWDEKKWGKWKDFKAQLCYPYIEKVLNKNNL